MMTMMMQRRNTRGKHFCVAFFSVVLLLLCSCSPTLAKRRSGGNKGSDGATASGGGDTLAAGEERFKELAAKFDKAPLPVLSLTDGNFSRFTKSTPRDYYVFLHFTALAAKYECGICEALYSPYREVAAYYKQQYNFADAPVKDRLAFFVVDVDNARNTFESMKFQTVPRLYLLPPREAGAKVKMSEYELDMSAAHQGVGGLLDEIERLSGIKIAKTRSPRPLLLGMALLAVLLALLISAAATDLDNAWLWYQSRYLWVLVSVVCYSVGVSGSIFCVIRSAPMYGWEGGHNGEPVAKIFADYQREQYFFEGFIVAAWTVGCGLAGLTMYYVHKVPLAPLRHLLVIAAMTVFVVLGVEIFQAYVDKVCFHVTCFCH